MVHLKIWGGVESTQEVRWQVSVIGRNQTGLVAQAVP